jgi:uncharacterized membrane protein YdbT with pleckstrin-like domain
MRTKLRDGERKIFETRAHWITVAKPFLVFLLAAVLLILSFALIKERTAIGQAARWACGVILAAAGLNFGYREWFRRRDIWAVTNLRVVDEQGIFRRYSKESPLDKINNLSYDQSLSGRIMNYGDVEIQTAAEDGATIYRKVAKPKQLKEAIAHYRDEYGRELQQIHAGPAAPPEEIQPEATRICPFCAETVKAQAKVCRYCGRDLPPDNVS